MDQLNAVLADDHGDTLVISVWVIAGTAGAGKTSLALRWAHQVRDRFPDGQLYVNLRGYDPGEPVTAVAALHGFLTALGVRPDSVPHDLDSAAALYRSLLADRRLLVVLDNAASVGQVRPLLPGGAGSLTVVTSRSRLSGLAVRDGARRLTLGTLPQPEAVALLRAVTAGYRPEDDPDLLAELAGLCARLPLALRIAAERAASHPHMRLDDLIADLRDESALWDALSTGDDGDAEAVRTVFAWSYRALPEQAARLFRLLGLHPGPEFGLQAAAALAALAVPRTRQLLDSLVGAHLLEQTGPDRYEFHDLLRAYATDQALHEEPPHLRNAALDRALTWYLHAADAAQSRLSPDEAHLSLPQWSDAAGLPVFPDYDSAVDWAEREYVNTLAAVHAAAVAHPHLAWQLATVLWNTRSASAPAVDWLAAGTTGLSAARLTGDRLAEAQLLMDLGMCCTEANLLPESLSHHRDALAIWRDTRERLGEADSLNLIGLVLLRRRQLSDASDHFAQAVAIFRELDSAHMTATALSNLATTQYNAGRLTEASAVAEEAMSAHRALQNRRGEGNLLRVLSGIEREQGEPERALRSAQQAVDIALTLRDPALEAYWLLALADAQQAQSAHARVADALVSYQRSAALHRRLANRSREALAWYGAGNTYHSLGRDTEAAHFHRQAAAVHRELGDGWNEALALDGLGRALAAAGDAGAAAPHWAEALRLLDGYGDPRATATREDVRRRLGA